MPPGRRIWLRREIVAGVGREPRVEHLRHRGVPQQVDDLLGVVAVPFHAHRQGLDAAQDEPAVHRTRDADELIESNSAILSTLAAPSSRMS